MTAIVTPMPKRELTRAQAVKEFFGTAAKPVQGNEIMQFMREDTEGFRVLADEALVALGAERKEV